jgi:hypothetical protein
MKHVKITVTKITQTSYPSANGNFHLTFTRAESSPDTVEIGVCGKQGSIEFENTEQIEELVDLLMKFMEREE